MAPLPATPVDDRRIFALISAADDARRSQIPTILALTAGCLAVLWVIADEAVLPLVVAAITICFFAASVNHAAVWRGPRAAWALVSLVAIGSWCAEFLGLTYGIPFGPYTYTHRLGPTALGVPLLVPLAWTMIAYPAIVIARRMTSHPIGGPVMGGLALGAWDLLVDPLMVQEGYWVWAAAGPQWAGVPLTNFLGWILIGTALLMLLWPFVPPSNSAGEVDDRVPLSLYAGSGVLLVSKCLVNDLPWVGLAGLAAMGPIVWLAAKGPGVPIAWRRFALVGASIALIGTAGLFLWPPAPR